jgi:hypothetical protein
MNKIVHKLILFTFMVVPSNFYSILTILMSWGNTLTGDDNENQRQEIIERVKSMVFSCMYCDIHDPRALSVVYYQSQGSGAHATGFFICSNCRNKFMVKIEDLGKVYNQIH